jgi:acylpyruvate hydrolase
MSGARVNWTDGLGLGRASVNKHPVVVLRRDGSAAAHVALVAGRKFDDLPALLEASGGDPDAIQAGEPFDVPDEALLSAVGRPRKIICVGQNYLAHARESGRTEIPDYPVLFPKWDNALNGPYAQIELPPESDQVDYESELGVVIGRRGRRIPAEHAGRVIFGYTAANDGSVRDFQQHTTQHLAGKAWDGLTPVGPVVVPAAQLGGIRPDLAVTGTLDGQVVQNDRTSSMMFGVPELVAYISTVLMLEAGDLILTGTPEGVGFVRTPPLLLRDGSRFEVSIEGIGTLRNEYVAERL